MTGDLSEGISIIIYDDSKIPVQVGIWWIWHSKNGTYSFSWLWTTCVPTI